MAGRTLSGGAVVRAEANHGFVSNAQRFELGAQTPDLFVHRGETGVVVLRVFGLVVVYFTIFWSADDGGVRGVKPDGGKERRLFFGGVLNEGKGAVHDDA